MANLCQEVVIDVCTCNWPWCFVISVTDRIVYACVTVVACTVRYGSTFVSNVAFLCYLHVLIFRTVGLFLFLGQNCMYMFHFLCFPFKLLHFAVFICLRVWNYIILISYIIVCSYVWIQHRTLKQTSSDGDTEEEVRVPIHLLHKCLRIIQWLTN